MSYTTITGKPAKYIKDGIAAKCFQEHTDGSTTNMDIVPTTCMNYYYKIEDGYVHLPTFATEAPFYVTLQGAFGEKEIEAEETEEAEGVKRINSKVLRNEFLRYLKEHPKERIPKVIEYFKNEYNLKDNQKRDMTCKWIPYKKPIENQIKEEVKKIITATV